MEIFDLHMFLLFIHIKNLFIKNPNLYQKITNTNTISDTIIYQLCFIIASHLEIHNYDLTELIYREILQIN